jgi:DNA-binding response OmpR family regulator
LDKARSKTTTTILLLVSDKLLRAVMAEKLEYEGFMVMQVGDLGTAVDWLKDCAPDLLVTRTYISNMPGHDAAAYLQKKCPHMRVLIVGGLLEDDRLQTRESLADFAVFPKPYTAGELIEKVKSVLASPHGQISKG